MVHRVGQGIFSGAVEGYRIGVRRPNLLGAQFSGRDGQDSGPGPQIKDRGWVRPSWDEPLQSLKAQLGSGMRPRSKGHPRIDGYDDLFLPLPVFLPGGLDGDSGGDLDRPEICFPGLGPFLLPDNSEAKTGRPTV